MISAVADFSTTLVNWDTRVGQSGVTGCYIFNGTYFVAYPVNGAGLVYYGQRVLFTFQSASVRRGTVYFVRYRVHDGTAWSDWQGDVKTW